jgi:hypothetical protein
VVVGFVFFFFGGNTSTLSCLPPPPPATMASRGAVLPADISFSTASSASSGVTLPVGALKDALVDYFLDSVPVNRHVFYCALRSTCYPQEAVAAMKEGIVSTPLRDVFNSSQSISDFLNLLGCEFLSELPQESDLTSHDFAKNIFGSVAQCLSSNGLALDDIFAFLDEWVKEGSSSSFFIPFLNKGHLSSFFGLSGPDEELFNFKQKTYAVNERSSFFFAVQTFFAVLVIAAEEAAYQDSDTFDWAPDIDTAIASATGLSLGQAASTSQAAVVGSNPGQAVSSTDPTLTVSLLKSFLEEFKDQVTASVTAKIDSSQELLSHEISALKAETVELREKIHVLESAPSGAGGIASPPVLLTPLVKRAPAQTPPRSSAGHSSPSLRSSSSLSGGGGISAAASASHVAQVSQPLGQSGRAASLSQKMQREDALKRLVVLDQDGKPLMFHVTLYYLPEAIASEYRCYGYDHLGMTVNDIMGCLGDSKTLCLIPSIQFRFAVGNTSEKPVLGTNNSLKSVTVHGKDPAVLYQRLVYAQPASTRKYSDKRTNETFPVVAFREQTYFPCSPASIIKWINTEFTELEKFFKQNDLSLDLLVCIRTNLNVFIQHITYWSEDIRAKRKYKVHDTHYENVLVFNVFYLTWMNAFSDFRDGYSQFDSFRLVDYGEPAKNRFYADEAMPFVNGQSTIVLTAVHNEVFGWTCHTCRDDPTKRFKATCQAMCPEPKCVDEFKKWRASVQGK